MPRKSVNSRFRFDTYTRKTPDDKSIKYVRVVDKETQTTILTRSTGGVSKLATERTKNEIREQIDLVALAKRKAEAVDPATTERDRLAALSVRDFLNWFWKDDSQYPAERKDAGRALSKSHLETVRIYLRLSVDTYRPFRKIAIQNITFTNIEDFVRDMRHKGASRFIIERSLYPARTALRWAEAHGIIAKPFPLTGLVLPEAEVRERGILNDDEVQAILALPTAPLWVEKETGVRRVDTKPRPRLKKGEKNEGEPLLDVRQKACVVIALLTGMRRGELLGLQWRDIDLKAGTVEVRRNVVGGEIKTPKSGSAGILPIVPELESMLLELRRAAGVIGRDGPTDYLLTNPSDPAKPNGPMMVRRAWERSLRHIGIDEATQEQRHLVLHGTRHRYATKLLDGGLSQAEAARLTRHKEARMLDRYGNHLQDTSMEKGRKALRFEVKPDKA